MDKILYANDMIEHYAEIQRKDPKHAKGYEIGLEYFSWMLKGAEWRKNGAKPSPEHQTFLNLRVSASPRARNAGFGYAEGAGVRDPIQVR